MKAEYWHQRWIDNKTGFDQSHPNSLLMKHWGALKLPNDAHVFVPLCGKTIDVAWLLEQGHHVTGVELHTKAVEDLFHLLNLEPEQQTHDDLTLFHSGQLKVWVGDIFSLKPSQLGRLDAVYDRAALVALPRDMRADYTKHLVKLSNRAPQIIINFDYDQSQLDGPPFVVDTEEMNQHYGSFYTIKKIDSIPVHGGLHGQYPAKENAWLLK